MKEDNEKIELLIELVEGRLSASRARMVRAEIRADSELAEIYEMLQRLVDLKQANVRLQSATTGVIREMVTASGQFMYGSLSIDTQFEIDESILAQMHLGVQCKSILGLNVQIDQALRKELSLSIESGATQDEMMSRAQHILGTFRSRSSAIAKEHASLVFKNIRRVVLRAAQ